MYRRYIFSRYWFSRYCFSQPRVFTAELDHGYHTISTTTIRLIEQVLKSCIMAEGDTNPMGDDALAEMQIDEVRAPPGPDNCGPFWRWEISEEQLVECVKDKILLVLRSYVDPKKKGKIQLHTILDP
ncbi:expressed unknown protein [Seminavis robusta]|uniref:Uncharacterized protein n=1 Tax=Seminavis robusta TaxID=568900 RepID=A0A9N8DVT4_9STRA|nr:expressed unknown protein [Seminavis robusta]|eukprot:Sro331_g119130.1 n/a (127) ;mRNA; f:38058-39471